MPLTPRCPDCGEPVPFRRTQWGLGQTFVCAQCGRGLVIEKNYWIPLAGFIVFWLLKGRMDSGTEVGMLFVGTLAAIWLLSLLFMPVERAER